MAEEELEQVWDAVDAALDLASRTGEVLFDAREALKTLRAPVDPPERVSEQCEATYTVPTMPDWQPWTVGCDRPAGHAGQHRSDEGGTYWGEVETEDGPEPREGGRWVSSDKLTPYEIAFAATRCRGWDWFVNGDGLGWAFIPDSERVNERPDAPCADADFGSYRNQVSMIPPESLAIRGPVGVDLCLASEIAGLWARGVRTVECCCGHGRQQGYIAVRPESAASMKALGYEPTNDGRFFEPKTACSRKEKGVSA